MLLHERVEQLGALGELAASRSVRDDQNERLHLGVVIDEGHVDHLAVIESVQRALKRGPHGTPGAPLH